MALPSATMPAMLFLDKRQALERLVVMSTRVRVPVQFLVESGDPWLAEQPLAAGSDFDIASIDAAVASRLSPLAAARPATEGSDLRVGAFAGVGLAA
jgi:hypothetical protein